MRCIPALLCSLASIPAHAGAWLQPVGEGITIAQFTHFTSDSYWDASGDRQSQPRYSKWEFQPYWEYGLTSRHTVGGSAFFQRAEQDGRNKGIADPELFLRTSLWHHGSGILSLQPLVKFPSYFEHNHTVPRGGSQSADAELSLLYGQNLHWLSPQDYADLRLGYRWRSHGLGAQYKADLALGLAPWEQWRVLPALRMVRAAQIDDATGFTQSGDLDYHLLKAELGVAYLLPGGDWLQATYFDHLSGRQTGDGAGATLSYAVRF